MRNCFRRSELELRGPRNDFKSRHCKASSAGVSFTVLIESDGDDEKRPAGAPDALFGGSAGGGAPPEEQRDQP
eukprot:2879668-Alexandrium_andersonii.AAC.1